MKYLSHTDLIRLSVDVYLLSASKTPIHANCWKPTCSPRRDVELVAERLLLCFYCATREPGSAGLGCDHPRQTGNGLRTEKGRLGSPLLELRFPPRLELLRRAGFERRVGNFCAPKTAPGGRRGPPLCSSTRHSARAACLASDEPAPPCRCDSLASPVKTHTRARTH